MKKESSLKLLQLMSGEAVVRIIVFDRDAEFDEYLTLYDFYKVTVQSSLWQHGKNMLRF